MEGEDMGLLPCGGVDNVNNGCGVIFERLPANAVLCSLCKKLQGLPKEEVIALRNTMIQYAKARQALGSTQTESAQARQARMDIQMHNRRASSSIGPATSETELSNFRANSGKVNMFSVQYELRMSTAPKSVDSLFGKRCVLSPDTTTMLGARFRLREGILKDLNARWVSKHISNLRLDETELRAKGNMALHPDDDALTIRQWYNKNARAEIRNAYIAIPTGMGKGTKGTSFAVEIFVDMDPYLARTGEGEESELPTVGQKRKASGTRGTSKRVKSLTSQAPLESSFDNGSSINSLPLVKPATTVYFTRIICTVDANTSAPSLSEVDTVEVGLLERDELEVASGSEGRTKKLYGLVIEGQQYVAKKLVNAGEGLIEGGVPVATALKCLTTDIVRLTRLRTFMDQFYARAREYGAEVANLRVSDGFLIKVFETKPNDTEVARPNVQAVYLVEPRRASTVAFKFTGTMSISSKRDKRTQTVLAFIHYVLQITACKYMFADMQGSLEILADQQQSVMVLFDPMTHTPEKLSGLGDHGLAGIQKFVQSHQCSTICRRLQLCENERLASTCKQLQRGQASAGDNPYIDEEDELESDNNHGSDEEE
ncbi:hypothetical protein EYR36_010649 [Pleurotus pulmonarius]|nr:hypothetical protein EYR36_010649 [Pleurotus pulmonarius]KAF4590555.1 hypothetical protein EYR38_009857 [Pleurotus pulmonarius]